MVIKQWKSKRSDVWWTAHQAFKTVGIQSATLPLEWMSSWYRYKPCLCPGCWSHVVIAEKLWCSVWFVKEVFCFEKYRQRSFLPWKLPKMFEGVGSPLCPIAAFLLRRRDRLRFPMVLAVMQTNEGFLTWADIKRKVVLQIVPSLLFHQATLSFALNNLENVVYSALQVMNCFPGDSGHLCLSLKLSDILVYFIW